MLGANFVFPFMPFFIQDLGIESDSRVAVWTGITGAATGLSLTLTAPIWGSLGDRYGRKAMMLRALFGAAAMVLLMGVAQNVWHLLGLRFGLGLFAGTMGAAAALVAATTPRAKVGQAMGTLQTGQFTANMLGPVIGGVAAAGLGLRQAFFLCAALYFVGAILTLVFVKEPTPEQEAAAAREPCDPPPVKKKSSGGIIQNLRIVMGERQIVVMLMMLFVLWLSTTFVRPVMPISIDAFADANERVHLWLPTGEVLMNERAATGILFGLIGGASTIAALALAPFGQRFGYRNAVIGAAFITGIVQIVVASADGFTSFLLLFGVVGLFQGAMVPGTSALIAAAVPEGKHGSAFGLAASMQSLAIMIGPLGGGFVAGVFGIRWVYVVIGILVLGAAVFGRAYVREPTGLADEDNLVT